MNSRTRNLLILAGLLIGLLILLRAGQKQLRHTNYGTVGTAITEEDTFTPSTSATRRSPEASKNAVETMDYPEIRRSRVGLNTVAYVTDKNGATALKVTVKTTKVCHAGDYEAIKALVGERGRVLLSLEPVLAEGKSNHTASRMLGLETLTDGVVIDLPANNKHAGVYGLYLCSDKSAQGACTGKLRADFNELISRPAANQNEDAVFFFQFVVIQEPDAQLYTGARQGLSRVREELLNQGMKDSDVRPALKKAAALMSETASLQSTTVNVGEAQSIVLPIAKFDKTAVCN